MKKIMIYLTILCVLLAFTGCGISKPTGTTVPSDPPESDIPETASPSVPETTSAHIPVVSPQQPLTSVFVPVQTSETAAEDGSVIFTHAFQNITLVAQDPDVADSVILDFLNQMDKSRAQADQILEAAQKNYDGSPDFNPFICRNIFTPMRVDQGVLSFFGEYAEYTGGTHASRNNICISYDMTNGHLLTLANILKIGASTEAFPALVNEALAQRDDLFEGYENTVNRRFTKEPSKDTSFYFTPSGMCFFFEPYEIAPYASGTVITEIPYEKLTGILDDAYFPAEKNDTQGTLCADAFENADLSQFSQIAEAVFDESGSMYLIHGTDTVQNVRIQQTSDHADQKTVFLAQSLSPQDAVMIQINPEHLSSLTVLYENASGEQVLPMNN